MPPRTPRRRHPNGAPDPHYRSRASIVLQRLLAI